jgi:hypothetical protein
MSGMSEPPRPPLDPIAIPRPRLQPRTAMGRRAPMVRAGRSAALALRRLVPWSIGAMSLFAAVVAGQLVWDYAAHSPHLQVRRIDVQGGKRTSRQEIVAYAGAELHQSMLKLDLDAMSLRLRQHPWIGQATIRRQLPDRLHIEVHEHEPVLLVSLGDLYLANAQGQLFKRFESQDQVSLPVVTGMDREGAVSRSDDVGAKLRTALILADAVSAESDTLGRLEEMHYDDDLGWNLILQVDSKAFGRRGKDVPATAGQGIRAQLGHAPVEHLSRVVAALSVLSERGQAPEVIWADGDRTPDRVPVELFAERGAPAAAIAVQRR